MSIETLPEEIWVEILLFLGPHEVLHLALTSKYFHRVCMDELLWHRIFYSQFPKNITLRDEENISWRREYFWRANSSNRVLYFNSHPMKCIKGMMRDGIITTPQSLAVFLKNSRISLTKKQEILLLHENDLFNNNDTKEDDNIIIIKEENEENNKKEDEIILLNYYLETFDFRLKSIVTSLREFIFEFGMPRTQRGIKKSATLFSQFYFKVNCNIDYPEFHVQNENDVYLLTYSAIMLNSDAHNPRVKEKMTADRFISTMITIIAGGKFPRELLHNMYIDITSNEIKEPLYISDKWVDRSADPQKKYSKALREVPPEFLSKPVIKTGFLKINEKTLVMERMKKRYFVSTRDYLFAYSTKQNIAANTPLATPNYAIPFNSTTTLSADLISAPTSPANIYYDNKGKNNQFVITTNSISYSIAAANDVEARDWLHTLLSILEQIEQDYDINFKIFSSEDKEEQEVSKDNTKE